MARVDQSTFELPDWYKALTLSERVTALGGTAVRDAADDEDLADRRLARWRAQEPFRDDGFFARRLSLDGLTEQGLRTLLGESAEAVRGREAAMPSWLKALEEAFHQPAAVVFPSVHGENQPTRFLHVIQPLLDRVYSRLLDDIRDIERRHPGAPFDAVTVGPLLAANLPSSLQMVLNRTMVLELQLARQEGRLVGGSPESRFESFIESLRDPEIALAILRQYPVLARNAVEAVDRWRETSLELLERLAADWTELCALFASGTATGPLVELRTGLGDRHRNGRSVSLLRFASGLRLIYKPKSLGVEAAFQSLLEWLGRKGFTPEFRKLRLLDRSAYGWVEFVAAGPCADAEEIRRYYLRQGGYLALLWLLDAVDFHLENLIASGEHPVLVDLEALFAPRTSELGREADLERIGRVAEKTVLATGLLPVRVWMDGGGEGVDLGGLSGARGQVTPPLLQAARLGTDEMHYALQSIELPAGDNLPVLEGEAVPVSLYASEVVDGFTRMVRLFQEHREEMVAPGGPLAAFAKVEVRIIIRPTRDYVMVLFETFHPYALGDALDRDRLLDRLWLATRENSVAERLIPAERNDLLRGDIPIFTTWPGTRDVWSSEGLCFPDLQPDSGLERVAGRLAGLDERELVRQSWLVHNSLASIGLPLGSHPRYDFREADPPAEEDLLAAAMEVGDRLESLALRGPRDAHWFTPQMTGSTHWELGPARLDLYLGLPGIALFLAWLGELAGAPRFTALAHAAVVTMREQLRHVRLTTIGAFSGWGGIVWTLTHLGSLWGDESLIAEAERIAVEEIPPLIPKDTRHDLIAGASGCLISLLTLHEVRPSNRLIEAAVQCGEKLLAAALPLEQGLGWHVEMAGPTPLAGLSHGAAGIAWPLLRLAASTGDRRYHDTALAGLAYERSLYRPGQRNWPDLRKGSTLEGAAEPYAMRAWCHGAPGIGLGRLAGLPWMDDPTVRGEIEIAVETTIDNGFGRNHCLCHGDLGNLELVTMAAARLGRPDWAERSGRIAGGVLASIRERGWLPGLPGRTEPPGIMLGLAGIGYGLLRLAAPKRIPSVLILEGPR